jgi:hypothetical protein
LREEFVARDDDMALVVGPREIAVPRARARRELRPLGPAIDVEDRQARGVGHRQRAP